MKKSNAGAETAIAENAIAAAWGVAEGTVFFIVPDVWISWVALKSRRRSLTTTLSALAGALVGGVATYKYSSRAGADSTRRFLAGQPAISRAMINRIEHEMVEEGPKTLMREIRSEEHTSELQSRGHLVCRLLLEKKKKICHIIK